ncbi:hypothetical protein ACOW85_001697 [Vibrio parahaemolyticus]|nr:hypothetical protein [Vibrio parahaemolyticus]
MNAYDITTTWVLVGVTAWVFHVVYAWSRSTVWLRNVMLSFDTFLIYVSWWPFVLTAIAAIYIKESCKENMESKYER